MELTFCPLSENWVRPTSQNQFHHQGRSGCSTVHSGEAARRRAVCVPPAGPHFLSCLHSGHTRTRWPTLVSHGSLNPIAGPVLSQESRILGRCTYPARLVPSSFTSAFQCHLFRTALVDGPVKSSLHPHPP